MTPAKDEAVIQKVRELAKQIRRDVILAIASAGTGHPGGTLGAAEIFASLYGHAMRHDPKNPKDPNRDRFILSNGHICAGFYAALARTGYFPADELAGFRKLNGHLQGHPARSHMPDMVETSSGPLGQGLSVANGLALAARLDGRDSRIYCLMGDGEMQEGQVWEALMTSAHYKLASVTLFVSYNKLQIDGAVEDVMGIEPLAGKLASFGWNIVDIDGHDVSAVLGAIEAAKAECDKPTAIIARTVMGKGVAFMEDKAAWHGGKLSWDQAREALQSIGASSVYTDFKTGEAR
jgi:transketolase